MAVLACVALGAWQFDRARTRDTPRTAGDPMAVAAVPLDSLVPADGRVSPGAQPVAVTVTGHYDQDHQILVPGREQGGTAATYVVTPLIPAQGKAVLVARGWFPADSSHADGAPGAPIGTVTVTGWLAPSEPLEAGTADPLAVPEGQVPSVTAARIAGLLPYPIVDGYVGLVDEQTAVSTQPVGPVLSATPNPLAVPPITASVRWSVQSLLYAFEWWFFALVVIWMWAQAVGIERRRVAADGNVGSSQAGDVPAAPPAP
jgi:cytochrome oxidase assembly protein ShyY1